MGESCPTRTTAPGTENDGADTRVVAAVAGRWASGKRTDTTPISGAFLPALRGAGHTAISPAVGESGPSRAKSSHALPQGDQKAGACAPCSRRVAAHRLRASRSPCLCAPQRAQGPPASSTCSGNLCGVTREGGIRETEGVQKQARARREQGRVWRAETSPTLPGFD